MHIVILADAVDNQNAGVYAYTKNLIESLMKFDRENRYTFIHSRENDFFRGTENFVITRRKIPGGESYRRLINIPNLIKTLKPDIVFEPCHIGPFMIPENIKRVVMIHDLTPILFPDFHLSKSRIIHKLFLKRVFKNADLILTPSEKTKKDIIRIYNPEAKIEAIYLAADEPNLSAETPNIDIPYILFLGTIEPRKNLKILIEAFLELKKEQNIPHKLVLAGAVGWKSKEILKIAKNPDILITGYLDHKQKAAFYKYAEMFVYPSIYEGFGLPPLEAMSYGVPVICSDGGSLRELFEKYSLMFPARDKSTLKKHIIRLISDKKLGKKMTMEGLEYAKNFSWEKTAKKTVEAFGKLLK